MAVQETVLCSATKDSNMQDKSLFAPCFFKTSNVFRWSLSNVLPQKRPREQLGISLVGLEIQK